MPSGQKIWTIKKPITGFPVMGFIVLDDFFEIYLDRSKSSKAHYRLAKAKLIARQTISAPHDMWHCAFHNQWCLVSFVHLNLVRNVYIMPELVVIVKPPFVHLPKAFLCLWLATAGRLPALR